MTAFNNTKFENYKSEVKEKWGETSAYKEHTEKAKDYSPDKWNNLADGMNELMGEFAICLKSGTTPDSDEAQSLVTKLQRFITENYYTCTNEILAGLGQMYVRDERFKNNIDKQADGTAEFINNAIKFYCK